MSERPTVYKVVAVPVVSEQEIVNAEERAYWLTILNALNLQKSGIEAQAATIRKRLGLEEERNTR